MSILPSKVACRIRLFPPGSFGRLWETLGDSGGAFGEALGGFGELWETLGEPLGSIWEALGKLWEPFKAFLLYIQTPDHPPHGGRC